MITVLMLHLTSPPARAPLHTHSCVRVPASPLPADLAMLHVAGDATHAILCRQCTLALLAVAAAPPSVQPCTQRRLPTLPRHAGGGVPAGGPFARALVSGRGWRKSPATGRVPFILMRSPRNGGAHCKFETTARYPRARDRRAPVAPQSSMVAVCGGCDGRVQRVSAGAI